MPLESFEQRGALLKIEVTEGTDAAPVAGTDGLLIMNGQSRTEANVIERVIDRSYFGHDPFVTTMHRASIEGDVELIGHATAGTAAAVGKLLRIGGMSETLDAVGPPAIATYLPISTSIPSGTAYWYHAGTLKKVVGARSSISGVMMRIGEYFKARARIEGACSDETEVAVPSITLSTFQAPTPATTATMSLTINGFAVDGVALSVDFGTELQTKQHTEAQVSRIVDRRPTFTAEFYRPLQASLNVRSLWRNHTLIPLIGVVDGGANKLARLTVGYGQIESVEDIDLEGDFGYRITGRCLPSAGNDEFQIDFE